VVETPELEGGQTYVLDVGELRARGEPDVHGNVLPPEVEAGQAHWSVLGPDAHAMVGRVEFVSADGRLAATMACSNCCPDSLGTAYVSPNPAYGVVGGSVTLASFQRNRDCYGNLGPGFPVAADWAIGDLQVIRIEIVTVTIFGEQTMVEITVVMGHVYYATYVTGWRCQAEPVSMSIGWRFTRRHPGYKVRPRWFADRRPRSRWWTPGPCRSPVGSSPAGVGRCSAWGRDRAGRARW
jgi:hypothetical protein